MSNVGASVDKRSEGVESSKASNDQVSDASSDEKGPFDLKFKVGDKVLARHGPLMYVARILEVDVDKGYFVHYDKWNHRWDEWATPGRIFEENEENRARAEAARRETLTKSLKTASSTASGLSNSSAKRRKEATGTSDEADEAQDEDGGDGITNVKLNLSDDLKAVVVKDWEQLTQHKKLCVLPKTEGATVEKIIDDFLATKKKAMVFAQICQGLLVYFDRAVPTVLLYKSERAQYERLKADNPSKRNCQIYGGEHLLRLFVRFPQLLSNTDLDENETKQLCGRLQDLIRFMSKKTTDYFAPDTEGYTDNAVNAPMVTTTSTTTTTTTESPHKADDGVVVENGV